MTNLPATITDLSYEQIAALTGQQTEQSAPSLARLWINKDVGPNDDKPYPVGRYAVTLSDASIVFGRPIQFRPFINAYQHSVYDADTNKYVNKSVIFTDWRQDQPDELGGMRCGKLTKRQLDGQPESVIKAQKAIRTYRLMYGTVTVDGVDQEGNKRKLENEPVYWRLSGESFMVPQDAIDELNKNKRLMFNHNLDLGTPVRKQNGATIYYVPVVSVDLTKSVQFTANDMDLFTKFQETIKFENDAVLAKHRKAVSKHSKNDDADDVIDAVGSSLDDDFGNASLDNI
jgi:hypothetical protein